MMFNEKIELFNYKSSIKFRTRDSVTIELHSDISDANCWKYIGWIDLHFPAKDSNVSVAVIRSRTNPDIDWCDEKNINELYACAGIPPGTPYYASKMNTEDSVSSLPSDMNAI